MCYLKPQAIITLHLCATEGFKCTITWLATQLGCGHTKMVELIDHLQDLKLVSGNQDTTPRARVKYQLTDAGKVALELGTVSE